LKSKGIEKVSSGVAASFTVAYTVGARDRIDVFAFPEVYRNHPWSWGRPYYGREVDVSTYTEGTSRSISSTARAKGRCGMDGWLAALQRKMCSVPRSSFRRRCGPFWRTFRRNSRGATVKKAFLATLLLAASAAALALPVTQREFDQVLKRTPDVANGARLYETCAACHGTNGEGVSDGSVPSLAGQSFNVIAKQIVDFRVGQRTDSRMAHFTDTRHLAYSQHVADVAAYIATLPRSSAKTAPPVGGGAMLYVRACERCHGPTGAGVEDTLAPRVAGQHYEYLLRQLEDALSGRRPTLVESHAALVRSLSRDDLGSIAAYLASTAGESSPTRVPSRNSKPVPQ
jgi:cytochrome c553